MQNQLDDDSLISWKIKIKKSELKNSSFNLNDAFKFYC